MIPAKYWSPTRKLMLLGAMAGGKAVEDTATGNPLTFITDKEKPLKSLLIPFTPIQQGTGDPSPTNVRSIVPWNGLTVWQGGKNLADFVDGKGIDMDGTINVERARSATVNPIPIIQGKSYIFTAQNNNPSQNNPRGIIAVWNGNTLVRRTVNILTGATLDTSGGDRFYFAIYVPGGTANIETNNPMIRLSTEPEGYEPYKPITDTDISFPSPVYGGTLDVVSGVLTVTHKILDTVWSAGETSGEFTNVIRKVFIFDDVLTGSNAKTRICNIAKYSVNYSSDTVHYYIGTTGGHGVAYVFLPVDTPADTPVQVCEELVTPITIQLTPEQITALVGNNTIWSDANGQLTAVYLKKA